MLFQIAKFQTNFHLRYFRSFFRVHNFFAIEQHANFPFSGRFVVMTDFLSRRLIPAGNNSTPVCCGATKLPGLSGTGMQLLMWTRMNMVKLHGIGYFK